MMFETIRRTLTRPWMDEREYRANDSGLRIVFGAVVHAPEKLAPSLLIWTLFQIALEFTPRRRVP